ncbi:hypothetical protein [Rhizobium terrae]|uniref:hypothetical protein n=1 Tax=Rhizobium terrae TaxID=2171756 RepID=UPI0013C3672E|nr:hypothetical protein [Rhizobium terrae]
MTPILSFRRSLPLSLTAFVAALVITTFPAGSDMAPRGQPEAEETVRFSADTRTSPYATQRVRIGANDARIEKVIPGSENNGWFNSISPIGRAGAIFGSRSSDNPTAGDSGTYGSGNFVIHDSDKSAWAGYDEIRVANGAGGGSGREINPISQKPLVPNDPVNIYAAGQVSALTLSSGRPDVRGSRTITAYLNLQANGADADKGINVGYNAVVVKNGQADAINLFRQHAIQQWSDTGIRGSRIRFDTTTAAGGMGIVFNDGAINFQEATPVTLFTISSQIVASAKPIKFPSSPIRALPPAAAVGAGATIYVTDDPKHRGLASSDGRNWRFMDGTIAGFD